MIWMMTDDELKAIRERLAILYASPDAVDTLTALLMDSDTGGFGLDEHIARAKAIAIAAQMKPEQPA